MLLDALGASIMLGEGVIQIQTVLLSEARSLSRRYAKWVAGSIASSDATTAEEKRQIARVMKDLDRSPPTEDEIMAVLEQMKELGLVEEVPPPEDDRFATENSSVPFEPPEDDQGPRCPACGIPTEQAQCDCTDWEKQRAVARDLSRVTVLLNFVDGESMEIEVAADLPLAEHPSWSLHADI
jgi:hypothetical protein